MTVAETSMFTVARYEPWGSDAIVWLRGEHDRSTVAAVTAAMNRAIAADDADVVVDLSGIDFMDASTAGVIVQARESLRDQSRFLQLRSPSRPAWRVVELCGLAGSVGRALAAHSQARDGQVARRAGT
jgi:anti-anti-sigma factor